MPVDNPIIKPNLCQAARLENNIAAEFRRKKI